MPAPSATRLLAIVIALLALGGCASWQPATTASAPDFQRWRQRVAVINDMTEWQLNGRISVSGEATEDAQGKLAWQQRDRAFKLNVRGPFGIGATRIAGDGQSVTVKNKDGEYYAANAEVAIREQIGWQVPIDSLRYWVLGRPAPEGIAKLVINSRGQLASITQHGWSVAYAEYDEATRPVDLPKRLVATRPGVQVRLAIDAWRLNP